ncbi:MAG: MFS transporter, partial [Magnetovibrio sp.]|nr:MFS transporter [Magnetovibrio sp.]
PCGASMGAGSFPALLPTFSESWSLSKTDAGWINGIYFAGYLGSVPILVSLTDRVSPRRIFYLSAAVSALSGLGFALWADGFWTAMVFRMLGGIGVAGTYMPGLKLLSDHLEHRFPDYDHSRGVAFYVSGFGLGLSLSFFLAGVTAEAWGWRWAFAVAALGPMLAVAVLGATVRGADPMTRTAPRTHLLDFRPVLRCRAAMGYVLAYTVHNFELFAFRAWAVAFLVFAGAESGTGGIGVAPATIIAGAILMGPAGSVLGNELSRRIGRRRAITLMMLASAALAAVIGFLAGQAYGLVVAVAVAYCVLQVSDSASLTAGAVAAAPEGYRGATMAVHSCIGFTGSFAGPVVFGLILDLVDPAGGGATIAAWGWAFAGVGAVVALGPVFLYALRNRS